MCKAHAGASGGRLKGRRRGWVLLDAGAAACFSPGHQRALLEWQCASGLLLKSRDAWGLELCFAD